MQRLSSSVDPRIQVIIVQSTAPTSLIINFVTIVYGISLADKKQLRENLDKSLRHAVHWCQVDRRTYIYGN